MEQRVGQRSADALVEEDEHGSTFALFGEAVTVPSAIALQQAVAFQFAQVVAELVQAVGLADRSKVAETA